VPKLWVGVLATRPAYSNLASPFPSEAALRVDSPISQSIFCRSDAGIVLSESSRAWSSLAWSNNRCASSPPVSSPEAPEESEGCFSWGAELPLVVSDCLHDNNVSVRSRSTILEDRFVSFRRNARSDKLPTNLNLPLLHSPQIDRSVQQSNLGFVP
jgi:hypothetical protein